MATERRADPYERGQPRLQGHALVLVAVRHRAVRHRAVRGGPARRPPRGEALDEAVEQADVRLGPCRRPAGQDSEGQAGHDQFGGPAVIALRRPPVGGPQPRQLPVAQLHQLHMSTVARCAPGGRRLGSVAVISHRCLSCAAGADRVLDHERAVVKVPRGYRGPPQSMHGGAAAGLVVCLGDAHLAAPTVRFNVRLHAPPPLLTELPYHVELEDEGGRLTFEIGGAGAPVLSGWAATTVTEPVVPPDIVAGLSAGATLGTAEQMRFDTHVETAAEEFSECFGCGSRNEDGLHLQTRPIDDRRAWTAWSPDVRWHDGAELATLAAVAALDCTSAFPLRHLGFMAESETALLGTYDGQIHRRPPAGLADSFRIVTAPRRRDGRKIYADIGLFSPGGDVFITGCATWIVLAA
jgi:hypothetical protein